jgi:ribosome-binding protein aMBF1 (putative translation factor)
MTRIRDMHEEWMRDDDYRAEYERLEEEFVLAHAIVEARSKAGLTQSELAERMNTSQSTIARLESGKTMPSGKRSPSLQRRRVRA